MFCTNCGNPVLSTHRFCRACGSKLENEFLERQELAVTSIEREASFDMEFDLSAGEFDTLEVDITNISFAMDSDESDIVDVIYSIKNNSPSNIGRIHVDILIFNKDGLIGKGQDLRTISLGADESDTYECAVALLSGATIREDDEYRVIQHTRAYNSDQVEILSINEISAVNGVRYLTPTDIGGSFRLAFGAIVTDDEAGSTEVQIVVQNISKHFSPEVKVTITCLSSEGDIVTELEDALHLAAKEFQLLGISIGADDLSGDFVINATVSGQVLIGIGGADCQFKASSYKASKPRRNNTASPGTALDKSKTAYVSFLIASHIRDGVFDQIGDTDQLIELSSWSGGEERFCDRNGNDLADGERIIDLTIATADEFFAFSGHCLKDSTFVHIREASNGPNALANGRKRLKLVLSEYINMSDEGLSELINIFAINKNADFSEEFSDSTSEIWDYKIGDGDTIFVDKNSSKGSVFVEIYPPVEIDVDFSSKEGLQFDADEHEQGRDEELRFVGIWSPS